MALDVTPDLGLPPAIARALAAFRHDLETALGERMGALVVYGSAVQGGYRPARSDLNLLVVLDRVTTSDLAAIGTAAGRHRRAALAPVVVTADDLAALTHTAPLVLFDLREAHVRLAGEPVLADVELSLEALAVQVRTELRDKLHRLRAAYLARHDEPAAVAELIARSFGSVMHLLRNQLRVAGRPAALNPVQALGEVARTLKLDLNLLRRLHAVRYGQDPLDRRRVPALCDDYLTLLTAVLARLDRQASATAEPATEPEAAEPPQLSLVPEAEGEPVPAPEATDEPEADEVAEPEPETAPEPEPVLALTDTDADDVAPEAEPEREAEQAEADPAAPEAPEAEAKPTADEAAEAAR